VLSIVASSVQVRARTTCISGLSVSHAEPIMSRLCDCLRILSAVCLSSHGDRKLKLTFVNAESRKDIVTCFHKCCGEGLQTSLSLWIKRCSCSYTQKVDPPRKTGQFVHRFCTDFRLEDCLLNFRQLDKFCGETSAGEITQSSNAFRRKTGLPEV
jgi:hypothetical protein